MGPEDVVLDGPEVAAVRELRVVVQVAEILDRRRVEPGGLQVGGDAGGGARHGPFRETRLDLVLVLPAAGDGRERLVEGPRGTAERAGEPPPVLVVVHGDGNPPVAAILVGAAEDAVRRRVARAVPQTREDLAVGGVGEERFAETDDPGLHLREVDVLAGAGAPPVEQRGGEQQRGEARRERVRDRAERPDRLAVGPSRQVVEARERRALPAEAGVGAVGPRLPAETW